MAEFLNRNATAVFGLIGVLAGVFLTFLSSVLLREKDLRMRIWEGLLDRRISAHESVISLAMRMRVMVLLGGSDSRGEVRRAPEIMSSREVFDQWLLEFARASVPASTWLSTAVKRELNFTLDYMVTLDTQLSLIPSERFLSIGQFIRQDFIDLSASLERIAFQFFKIDAGKLSLGNLDEHHKYLPEETERRFQSTILISKWKELQALLEALPPGHD
jgi:hypothetical protein